MTQRQTLIACLEKLLPLLEARGEPPGDGLFVSSQQPFGEVASWLWNLRRGRIRKLWTLGLLFAESGPLSRTAEANGWASEYRDLECVFWEAFRALNRVRYHASETPVQLGDRVELRVLLRRRSGRVTYLPGVSKARAEIDFGGLFRVGIAVPDGAFVMVHVDPETLEVKKGVEFRLRDPSPCPALPTDKELQA